MGKALLWLEFSAAVLLLHAMIAACIARFSRRTVRWLLYAFLCLPGLIGYGLLTAFVARWRFGFGAEHFPIEYVGLLAAAYLVGIVAIAWKGMRAPRSSAGPPAANWPRGKLALAAAVAIGLETTTFSNLDLAVKERITRSKLEAAALAQSVAPSRPADSENAGPLYLEAIHNFHDVPTKAFEAWQKLFGGESPFNPQDSTLRKYLNRHEADIKTLREAAKRPRCYFDREYGRPRIDILIPETQEMRLAALMLYLHARERAASGDLATAAQDISAQFGIARHVTEEPFLVSGLVAAAIHRVATRTLAEILESSNPTEQQLAAFEVPGELSFVRIVRRCMTFEEAMAVGGSVEMLADPLPGEAGYMFLSPIAKLKPQVGSAPSRWTAPLGMPLPLSPQIRVLLPLYRVFLLPHELLVLRDHFQEIRNASIPISEGRSGDFPRVRQAVEKVEREVESRRLGLLPLLVWPPFIGSVVFFQEADIRTDLARLVLAAARFRAKNGKYPGTLVALVPDYIQRIPLDSFDGKPIKLRREGKAWTVFSGGRSFEHDEPIELTLHE
ncbi:MAG TPA: hypothetical protein VMR25_07900 [Planctomycetaceae bacterium]|nr:hypothetical protein [Planctomycetaceae bacterium]